MKAAFARSCYLPQMHTSRACGEKSIGHLAGGSSEQIRDFTAFSIVRIDKNAKDRRVITLASFPRELGTWAASRPFDKNRKHQRTYAIFSHKESEQAVKQSAAEVGKPGTIHSIVALLSVGTRVPECETMRNDRRDRWGGRS